MIGPSPSDGALSAPAAVSPPPVPSDAVPPVLHVSRLSKSFGGARALDDVSLEIRPGEIHGLLGENGSGKSTLIKILAGYHDPEPGAVLELSGAPLHHPIDQHQLRQRGVSFVHQDLGLIPSLTVTDNFHLVQQEDLPRTRIAWSKEHARVRNALAGYGVDVEPTAVVERLSPVQQALVAVVRAVTRRSGIDQIRLLVLDEPTVFLPAREVGRLFELMTRVAASGAGVLFVTHDMGEVLQITNKVTVLRDGRLQATRDTAATTERDLVELILGRNWSRAAPQVERGAADQRPDVVTVTGLSSRTVTDVSLAIREGEVLGVTGLVGSGFEHLPYLLMGAECSDSGELTVRGRTVQLPQLRPTDAVATGTALVPANRQADAVVADFTVESNISLPTLPRFFSGGRLRHREITRHTDGLLKTFDVRPAKAKALLSALSGGNQQKAVLAKWLQVEPQLLLLHEPTQGVDVGARAQIAKEIRRAAASGTAVLVASSDYEHLEDVADRVLVMASGALHAELRGDEVTKRRISEVCLLSTTGTAT